MSIIKRKAGSEDIVKSILEFDEVPTEGSPNLVESGSVAQAIGNLGQPLQWKGPATVSELNAGITGIQPGWTYTLTDAGTLTDGSIDVDAGDEVAWTEDDEWFKVGGDTINAVKYIPKNEIKVGADIFNLSDASYSPTHWSVSGDEISFTTTSATNDEFDTGIAIPSNGKYFVEVTISNYTRLADLFYFKLGASGDKIDIYNGTATPSGSLIGNGGNLIIYTPFENISFTLTIKLSPVVTGDVYARSITLDVKNVSCGNGDGSIIDAKWNVAIGPREDCFANNVNATRCIAIGYRALRLLTSGWQNIAIGTFAMSGVTRGERNISIGSDNTYMLPNAFDNVAIGRTCLLGLGEDQGQTAQRNVVIGSFSGRLNTAEEVDSVYIGDHCAQSGMGSRCVFIGANVPGYGGGGYNRIGIGYNVFNNEDNTTVIGSAAIKKTTVYGNLIVEGTDHVKRKIVFNNDNTVTWEALT